MHEGFCFAAFFSVFFTWSHSATFPSVGWVKYEVLLFIVIYAIVGTVTQVSKKHIYIKQYQQLHKNK
jgi:uncharacterized membrane protein